MYRQARVLSTVAVLFLVSLVLTAYSVRHPHVGQIGSRFYQHLTSPLQLWVNKGWGSIVDIWDSYIWLFNTSQKNQELQKELTRLQAEVTRLQELPEENASLREVLELKQKTGYQGIVASVIGYDPSGWIRSVTVNRGAQDNVKTRLPVIQGGAVVGQVISVADTTSQVLLLTDRSSGVAALSQRKRARGIVSGLDRRKCTMQYVREDEDVLVGDAIVTSGMDGIFPKGLKVGQVTRVHDSAGDIFKLIELKPAVDFAHLETLFIVTDVPEEEEPEQREPIVENGVAEEMIDE